ncbi:Di- and tricarboxylate transporters-like protein [Novosphingobium aromaticivorans DSM 12444]|uniref:Di-and tricarboxylate transporters-like protein n=1 Tax=Novosphingobium aromaticivorans (strain ATCC 700278 / DSM 12444 / CCUG 56034 / CIP 105152 / NBRC 16084 / F199) TaxID=279238 RepID=Q2G884_NOVAD|nr:SLC13 family permease [Novosphingobium aromaticivorans]ABD25939.1 Di- and tricarboxylate transporters-like protein [Novosphingobium aromaticivorans DSM 12444]SCY97002.1 Di-and tricarboxylate transporter [Novosphingobium aromaticivorans]
MTLEQILTLVVLVGVVAALIADRMRADVVALSGAAILLVTGAVRPSEVQGAFASPAILTLASLFVIAYAMELSGLLDKAIEKAVVFCRRTGAAGLWGLIGMSGVGSAFLNNTPIVVVVAPVIRDVAKSIGLDPRRFLMPLSYVAVLGGSCTLIGTSTNLLVDDMARTSGQAPFGIFEITPVGLAMALAGGMYLVLFTGRLVKGAPAPAEEPGKPRARADIERHSVSHVDLTGDSLEDTKVYAQVREYRPRMAFISVAIFIAVIAVAAINLVPIAAAAFAGAVLLILLRVISPDQAYAGLRPEILLLIAGMVVIGIAMEQTGLAAEVTQWMIGSVNDVGPLTALIFLYGATLLLTELLSNATVAVLLTPVAVALAESLGVSPRPFLVTIMMAASAAFATPFGYQTNVLVYQMGGYRYMDFMKVGLPLNLLTWAVAVMAIHHFFPF